MRTASPPYDRHLWEVNDLLDAGQSGPEIMSAIDETELDADEKAALCLVASSSDNARVDAGEAQHDPAIAGAKDRAWRVALRRRSQRRRQDDDGMRYGDATKYGESGLAISPPQTLIARVRRLLHP